MELARQIASLSPLRLKVSYYAIASPRGSLSISGLGVPPSGRHVYL